MKSSQRRISSTGWKDDCFCFSGKNLGHNFMMRKKNVGPETPRVENQCFNTLSASQDQFTDSKLHAGNLSGRKS